MSTTTTLTDYPAFRLQVGDEIRHANRRWQVRRVELAYRFARGRHETSRSVLKVTLQGLSGGATTLTLEHCDTVRAYR